MESIYQVSVSEPTTDTFYIRAINETDACMAAEHLAINGAMNVHPHGDLGEPEVHCLGRPEFEPEEDNVFDASEVRQEYQEHLDNGAHDRVTVHCSYRGTSICLVEPTLEQLLQVIGEEDSDGDGVEIAKLRWNLKSTLEKSG